MAHKSTPSSISLCMIVKNEQHFLARCLESVQNLVSEIIVCDTGSQDNSKQIALGFGAKVYDLPWIDSFADARNNSLSHAKSEWILVLDADEALEITQHQELKKIIEDKKCYSLKRRHYCNEPQASLDIIQPQQYHWPETPIGYFTTHDIRLFPNDPAIRFKGDIHESVEESVVESNIYQRELCDITIHHFGPLKDAASRQIKNENYIALCMRKLSAGVNDWKSWFEIGVELQQLGMQTEAMNCLREAIMICSDYHPIWLQMGIGMLELGNADEALKCLSKALKISPKCSLTWNALGVTFMRLNNLDDAMHCFQTILDSNPAHMAAQANMLQAQKLKSELAKG